MENGEEPEVLSDPENEAANGTRYNPRNIQSRWKILSSMINVMHLWKNTKTENRRKWVNRRLRLANKGYGGIKEVSDTVDSANFIPIRKKPSVFDYTKEYILPKNFQKKQTTKDVVDSSSVVLDTVLARNDSPREFGVGAAGDALQNEYTDEPIPYFVRQQMDEMEDYRPYFSYWINTVQMIVMIISLCWYNIAPIDVELSLSSDFVLTESLAYQQVAYYQPSNFWIGPSPADVIHLGAVFSPCMREDKSIQESISIANARENELSGCCVRNDASGCLQTTKNKCSPLLSTFYKWSWRTLGPNGRTQGPVCGQDPGYCLNPASQAPHTWVDDLRKWPVCKEANLVGGPPYMTCKVTAKPCCIGIHGRCEMRSKEYCDFVKGHFHPEANLCSQVSCMQDVCGMFSFVNEGSPDQFYRLWTSLFLHAGVVHLVISLIVQWFIMRDLERLIGPLRMAALYFGSGEILVQILLRKLSGRVNNKFQLIAKDKVSTVSSESLHFLILFTVMLDLTFLSIISRRMC